MARSPKGQVPGGNPVPSQPRGLDLPRRGPGLRPEDRDRHQGGRISPHPRRAGDRGSPRSFAPPDLALPLRRRRRTAQASTHRELYGGPPGASPSKGPRGMNTHPNKAGQPRRCHPTLFPQTKSTTAPSRLRATSKASPYRRPFVFSIAPQNSSGAARRSHPWRAAATKRPIPKRA